jgi:VIT1/CCC1 family predicted Fe2+/Mn2+ transporter
MHRIYLATLTALFSFMAAVAAETQQSHVNFDIWFVNDLVEDLSKDDFSERERATLRLIALGPIVVQEINEHISIERLDAEARERLERVKRDAEFALLTTFESATAEYERIVNEVLELDAGRYAQLVLEKRARAESLAHTRRSSRRHRRTPLQRARQYRAYACAALRHRRPAIGRVFL